MNKIRYNPNYWDKPSRNKNKLNLNKSQRNKLLTVFGKDKKKLLKEFKNEA